MDRGEAAVLLGVALDAPPDEVRAAFRRRVWSAHPDAASGTVADLDVLTKARDRMLEPPVAAETEAARPSVPPPGRPSRPPNTAEKRPSVFRFVWAVLVPVVAVVAVTFVAIFIVAAVRDDGATVSPSIGSDTECLVIGADAVEPVSCAVEGAQRLVGELTEGDVCPSGTSTLGAGSRVWCLEPASR